jgi:segregation and condensation protein B
MSDDAKIPLPRSLQEIVGALLFASEVPLTAGDLRESVRAVEPEDGENRDVMDVYRTCTAREIESALKGLEKALDVAGCGFQLVCTGGTYRLQTSPSCGRYVRAMLKLDRPSRLGRASLETLAIVAYRQPITKSEIEEIRGVDVSANIKTLMELQLVRLVGKSELPGHPFLYGTTPLFLEHFGLANLEQLNKLDPTLQRSNPRLKAAAYKKPVKTELEKAAETSAAPESDVGDAAAVPTEAVAGAVATPEETESVLTVVDLDDGNAPDAGEMAPSDADDEPDEAADEPLVDDETDDESLIDDEADDESLVEDEEDDEEFDDDDDEDEEDEDDEDDE